MASHALASIRLLQRKVALTPAIARRKVVILGDAERLVVQEASPEAANAMLKVLEEPPADTVLMLTAADPQALLPTIRSRVVPIRVGPVSDETVRAFLGSQADPPVSGAALDRRVVQAEGSIGRALWPDTDNDTADRAAERFLEAVNKGPQAWSAAALSQAPWSARGEYTALLDAMALRLRAHLMRDGNARWARALRRVETARWDAQGNLNPQLGLAVLAQDLRRIS
jgi:DNA polymerase-3 subunit delta'